MLILYGRAIEETLITSTAYKSIGLKKIKYKTIFKKEAKTSLHRGDRLGSFKRIKYEVLALQSGVSMQYRSFKLFTEKTDLPVTKLSMRMQKILTDWFAKSY